MKHLILISAVLFCSCGEDVTTIVVTPGATVGTIRGKVKLFDSIQGTTVYDIAHIPDASGVRIELEGTVFQIITDATGAWELRDVPTGMYKSLLFTKDGFSFEKEPEFAVIGNGTQTYGTASLFRKSHLSVELTLRGFEEYYHIEWRDSISRDENGQTSTVRYPDSTYLPFGKALFTTKIRDAFTRYDNCYSALFFSHQPHINPLDPTTFQYYTNYKQHDQLTAEYEFELLVSSLQWYGFQPGEKIYCVAYGGKQGIGSTNYYDRYNEETIYTGFSPNHSEVKSFVLP